MGHLHPSRQSDLLAAMLADQTDHAACVRPLQDALPPLVLSPFVLAELDDLIGRLAGVDAELALRSEVSGGRTSWRSSPALISRVPDR